MPIEEFLKSLVLPKKYYDSNFDMSEKYAEEADAFISGLKKIDALRFLLEYYYRSLQTIK